MCHLTDKRNLIANALDTYFGEHCRLCHFTVSNAPLAAADSIDKYCSGRRNSPQEIAHTAAAVARLQ